MNGHCYVHRNDIILQWLLWTLKFSQIEAWLFCFEHGARHSNHQEIHPGSNNSPISSVQSTGRSKHKTIAKMWTSSVISRKNATGLQNQSVRPSTERSKVSRPIESAELDRSRSSNRWNGLHRNLPRCRVFEPGVSVTLNRSKSRKQGTRDGRARWWSDVNLPVAFFSVSGPSDRPSRRPTSGDGTVWTTPTLVTPTKFTWTKSQAAVGEEARENYGFLVRLQSRLWVSGFHARFVRIIRMLTPLALDAIVISFRPIFRGRTRFLGFRSPGQPGDGERSCCLVYEGDLVTRLIRKSLDSDDDQISKLILFLCSEID